MSPLKIILITARLLLILIDLTAVKRLFNVKKLAQVSHVVHSFQVYCDKKRDTATLENK